MNRIINPNAQQQSPLDSIIATMRVIAQYRQSFFDLEAAKQNNGAQEPLTATQLDKVCDAQQKLMHDMVDFILYGDRNGKLNTDGKTPTANIKEDASKLTQTEEGRRNTLLT